MPVGSGGGLGRAAYSASNSRCRLFIISNSSGVSEWGRQPGGGGGGRKERSGLFGGETGSSAFATVTLARLNPRISSEAPTSRRQKARDAMTRSLPRPKRGQLLGGLH